MLYSVSFGFQYSFNIENDSVEYNSTSVGHSATAVWSALLKDTRNITAGKAEKELLISFDEFSPLHPSLFWQSA